MTWSIVGRDDAGRFGVAVASKFFAVGALCIHTRRAVGALSTQALMNQVAILMVLLLSVQLGWLPASGYECPFVDLQANLATMTMPAFVLVTATTYIALNLLADVACFLLNPRLRA